MKNKHTLWLLAFAVLAFLEIWAEASANTVLRYWTKPLLMPALSVWFALETAGERKFARNTVLSALGFSAVGDIFLLFADTAVGPLMFLLGVGAFLFAHFFYTGYFYSKDRRSNGYVTSNPVAALPLLCWLAGFLWWLWPGIPEPMRVPVVLYAVVLTAMATSVVNLRGQVTQTIFRTLLAGALLFLLSDTLLAFNKFGRPFAHARVAVMLTYLGAQYLLVDGARQMIRKQMGLPKS